MDFECKTVAVDVKIVAGRSKSVAGHGFCANSVVVFVKNSKDKEIDDIFEVIIRLPDDPGPG
jgi:hypothetical protein